MYRAWRDAGQHARLALDGLADEALLGLAARDPEAFAVFYRRHAESTLRFVLRRTACPETAADLTAETVAQAYLSQAGTGRPGHRQRPGWRRLHVTSSLISCGRAEVANRGRHRLGMRPAPVGDEPYEHLMESIDARRDSETVRVAMSELTDGVADAGTNE